MKSIKKSLLYIVVFIIGMFVYCGQVYAAADATCIYEGINHTYIYYVNASDTGKVDFTFEHKLGDPDSHVKYNITNNVSANNFINTTTNKIVCPNYLYFKMVGGGTTTGITLSFESFSGASRNPISLSDESTNNDVTLNSNGKILNSCKYTGSNSSNGNIVADVYINLTKDGLSFEATNGYIVKNNDEANINVNTFTENTKCSDFKLRVSCGSHDNNKFCTISKFDVIRPGTESSGTNTPSAEDINSIGNVEYKCSYIGQVTGNWFNITKTDKVWYVELSDGKSGQYPLNSLGYSYIFPSSNCEDMFMVTNNGKMNLIALDVNDEHLDSRISTLCYGYGNTVQQFCHNNSCKISNPLCGSSVVGGEQADNGDGCPWQLRAIIIFLKKVVFDTVRLIVPIVLIIMGTIDFVKAVASPDDKGNKEAISKFIRRCLAAIMVFFVGTIVTIVMNMFSETDMGKKNDWQTCWETVD